MIPASSGAVMLSTCTPNAVEALCGSEAMEFRSCSTAEAVWMLAARMSAVTRMLAGSTVSSISALEMPSSCAARLALKAVRSNESIVADTMAVKEQRYGWACDENGDGEGGDGGVTGGNEGDEGGAKGEGGDGS